MAFTGGHLDSIAGPEDVAEVFSILHDGEIASATVEGGDLVLEVEIQYLAERVRPDLTKFSLRLHRVQDVSFATWPKVGTDPVAVLTDHNAIFEPPLEILSCKLVDGRLEVACNQGSPSSPFSGGTLYLHVGSASVTDQLGKTYSLAELGTLCDGYWNEWSSRRGKT